VHSKCPGALDQDAAHGFRGGHEEVVAAVPVLVRIAHQAEPGFVDQRCGLERVPGRFLGHLVSGQLTQLFINQRQQFLGGAAVALPDAFEDPRDVAHGSGTRDYRLRGPSSSFPRAGNCQQKRQQRCWEGAGASSDGVVLGLIGKIEHF
jgi:hypothetical protein